MLLAPPAALQTLSGSPPWQSFIACSWQSQRGLQSSASPSRGDEGESGGEDNN